MSLLTPGKSNSRVRVGIDELGLESMILNLSPFTKAGQNVCPFASPLCAEACYDTAGYGRFENIQDARRRRTVLFHNDRDQFMARLVRELENLEKRAVKKELKPVARLNNSSDLRWESIPCVRDADAYPNVMTAFPAIQFYDYTKIPNRRRKLAEWPPNYHLTFSLSETNDRHALAAIEEGLNVAAVIAGGAPWPETWSGYPVVDGDANDFRFLDPEGGHIVALKPRGRLIAAATSFVRDRDGVLDPRRVPTFAMAVTKQMEAGA